jgi:hypothetical protein
MSSINDDIAGRFSMNGSHFAVYNTAGSELFTAVKINAKLIDRCLNF